MANNNEDSSLAEEFQDKWHTASQKFSQTTNGKCIDKEKPITPSELADIFRRKQEKDDPDKWIELAKIVQKTCEVLITIGKVAASLGSIVFPPSDMAMNAVSFFVQGAIDCRKVFKDLELLFQRIAAAMDRLDVYTKVDPKVLPKNVRRIAHEILLRLVSTCEVAYRVLEGNRAKFYLGKLLLNTDGGVKKELERLDELTQQEALQLSANTWVNSVEILAIGNQSLNLQKKQELESERTKQDALFIRHLVKDSQSEEWRKLVNTKDISPESGNWIKDNKTFTSWENSDQNSILFLRGAEATGKTTLVSRIVNVLQEGDKDPKGIRIAYFFTGGKGDLGRPDATSKAQTADKITLETALRSMAFQFTQSDDDFYRKNLYNSLLEHVSRNHGRLTPDVKVLFKLLFVDSVSHFTLVLLLDNLQDLAEPRDAMSFLKSVHEPTDQVKVKVLATIRQESDVYQQGQDSELKFPQIDLGLENKDIIAYAHRQVEALDFLKNPNFEELRKQVQETLSSRQSFKQIKLILSEIQRHKRVKYIPGILEKYREERGSRIAIINLLERCNDLDEDDITDLNSILEWILSDFPYDLDVRLLSEVTQFRNPSPAIRSLQKRMGVEFEGFFKIEEHSEIVTIDGEDIENYFREHIFDEEYDTKQTPTPILIAEVNIVKKMLSNMCDEELYKRFGFDEFFRERAQNTTKVHVDVKNMHAQVALDCMRGIVEKKTDLKIYMYMRYTWHIMLSRSDLAQVNHKLKKEIGRFLVPMLCEDSVIDSWAPWDQTGEEFVLDEKLTQTIMKWLEDSVVQKGVLEARSKEWVKTTSNSTAVPCEKVWSSVVRRIAQWWLLEAPLSDIDIYGSSYSSFRWIQGFLQQTKQMSSEKEKRLNGQNWYHINFISSSVLRDVIKWAKKVLDIDDLSASSFCRIGDLYRCFEKWSEAVQLYRSAEEKDPELYQATSGKADAEWKLEHHHEAILTLQSAIKKQEKREPSNIEDVHEKKFTLANWYTSVGNYDAALEIYKRSLEIKPDDYHTINAMIDVYGKSGNQQTTREFLDTLMKETDEVYQDKMTKFLVYISRIYGFDERSLPYRPLEVAKKVGYLDRINEKLRRAITASKERYNKEFHASDEQDSMDEGEDSQIVDDLLALYHRGARWLYFHHTNGNEEQNALTYAEEAFKLSKTLRFNYYPGMDQLAIWLSHRYLAKARDHSGSKEEGEMIDRVKAFCPPKNIQHTDEMFPLTQRNVDALLGFYYADQKQISLAMEHLKPEVNMGLAMLSNETTDDDWIGFRRLGQVFTRCNDNVNATAAFSLVAPTNQTAVGLSLAKVGASLQEQSTSERTLKASDQTALQETESQDNRNLPDRIETKNLPKRSMNQALLDEDSFLPMSPMRITTSVPELSGPMTNICDGRCGHRFTYASDMYWCKNCPDVQFDRACHEKLMNGDLGVAVCDKDHKFFYTPPWDIAKSSQIGEDMVDVGGNVMTVGQWLSQIRKTWGIGTEDNTEGNNVDEKRIDHDTNEEEQGET